MATNYRIVSAREDRAFLEFQHTDDEPEPGLSADHMAETDLMGWAEEREGEWLLFKQGEHPGTWLLVARAEYGESIDGASRIDFYSYRPQGRHLVREGAAA